MSRDDDPFGSKGGRTVIRPNPGGARPDQGPGPGPARPNPGGARPNPGGPRPDPRRATWQPGQDEDTQSFDPFSVGGAPDQFDYGQPSRGQPYRGQNAASSRAGDWLGGAAPDQFDDGYAVEEPPVAQARVPLEVALRARDGEGIIASNPLLAAATPLLILLGRLRRIVADFEAPALMHHVADLIDGFERRTLDAGIDSNIVAKAKYVLCGTADDVVQNLPGHDASVWVTYSMLARYFRLRTSGVGFYQELNKILSRPGDQYDLLELMHACLCLGFEGQYRNAPEDLQRQRSMALQTLRRLRERPDDDVSPHWRGTNLKMQVTSTKVPVWAIASAAGAIVLAAYLVLRILIAGDADVVADHMVALVPDPKVELIRQSVFKPAEIPDTRDQTQLERIRQALAEDIDKGGVAADSIGDEIVVLVNNVLLFDSGSAVVQKEFSDVAVRVANALKDEPGQIMVVGYTDNVQPSGLGKYKSNFDLSVARAKAVQAVMTETIGDPERFSIEGRGEQDPVDDNSTAEGRAKNRRVEIMIPREETLDN